MKFKSQILFPANYLYINHTDDKRQLREIFLPLIPASLFTLIYVLSRFKLSLIGDEGIFSSVSDLLQLLSAFYLAGLAAIATFGNENLNKSLRGGEAYIYKWSNSMQRKEKVVLSRRAFLTRQFAYLSWMSIIAFLIISLFESSQEIIIIKNTNLINAINSILCFIGIYIVSNIIYVSSSAILFLASRLNKDEAE